MKTGMAELRDRCILFIVKPRAAQESGREVYPSSCSAEFQAENSSRTELLAVSLGTSVPHRFVTNIRCDCQQQNSGFPGSNVP